MRSRALALVACITCVACGRGRFEPLDDTTLRDANSGGNGDGPAGDSGGGGGDGPGPDAAVTACTATAPTTVAVGTTTVNTCATATDLIDGCGPAGTQEIVLRFDVPTTRGYNLAARDPGTMNVSNSTTIANAGCTAIGSCAGILGQSFTAGQTLYIVLEASSGGCATVDFNIQ